MSQRFFTACLEPHLLYHLWHHHLWVTHVHDFHTYNSLYTYTSDHTQKGAMAMETGLKNIEFPQKIQKNKILFPLLICSLSFAVI